MAYALFQSSPRSHITADTTSGPACNCRYPRFTQRHDDAFYQYPPYWPSPGTRRYPAGSRDCGSTVPYHIELVQPGYHTTPWHDHSFHTSVPAHHHHDPDYDALAGTVPGYIPMGSSMGGVYGNGHPSSNDSASGTNGDLAPSFYHQYQMQTQQTQYLPAHVQSVQQAQQVQQNQQYQQHQQYQQYQEPESQEAASDTPQDQPDQVKKSKRREGWAKVGRVVARTTLGIGSIAGLGVSIWQGIEQYGG